MNIAIGINHAIVGEDRTIGGRRTRVYRDLGVGQHTLRLRVPDKMAAPEAYQTIVSSMQHHLHPKGQVYWVECPNEQLRLMLMRQYNVPDANITMPPNWGLPKDENAEPDIVEPESVGDTAHAEPVAKGEGTTDPIDEEQPSDGPDEGVDDPLSAPAEGA